MLEELFPSYIFHSDATKLNIFADIQEEIKKYLATKKPNYLPWFGRTHKLYEPSFQIGQANLLGHCPLLRSFIIDQITQFIYQFQPAHIAKLAMNNLSIGASWATKFNGRDYAHQHHHIPDEISGVYYYQVPSKTSINTDNNNEHEGNLFFCTPVTGHHLSSLISPAQRVYIAPQEGQLILFPSFLEHGVMPCDDKEKSRISISFNGSIHSNIVIQQIMQRDTQK